MSAALQQLLEHPALRLTTGSRLAVARHDAQEMPLEGGHCHEWFLADVLPGGEKRWQAPLTVMTLLAGRRAAGGKGRLAFIGRACWPAFGLLAAALASAGGGVDVRGALGRCVFLDPATAKERHWAIGEALRCTGITAVLADASGADATVSRRLQLAAEGNPGVVGFLARPPGECGMASWAATRWSVRAGEGGSGAHCWQMDYLGGRMRMDRGGEARRDGGGTGQDAAGGTRWMLDWTYQVLRGTGAFHLSAGVGHRTGGAAGPRGGDGSERAGQQAQTA